MGKEISSWIEQSICGNRWRSLKRASFKSEKERQESSDAHLPIARLADIRAMKGFPSMEYSSVISYKTSGQKLCSFPLVVDDGERS